MSKRKELDEKQNIDPWDEPELNKRIKRLLIVDEQVRILTDGIIQLASISRTAALGVCESARIVIQTCVAHDIKFDDLETRK